MVKDGVPCCLATALPVAWMATSALQFANGIWHIALEEPRARLVSSLQCQNGWLLLLLNSELAALLGMFMWSSTHVSL